MKSRRSPRRQRQIARQFLRQKLGICTRQGQADGVLAARHIEAHAERSALGAVPGDVAHRSVEINCRKGHLRHPLRYGFSSWQCLSGKARWQIRLGLHQQVGEPQRIVCPHRDVSRLPSTDARLRNAGAPRDLCLRQRQGPKPANDVDGFAHRDKFYTCSY